MVSEVHGLRVALFIELSPEERVAVQEFFISQNSKKDPTLLRASFERWSSESNKLLFCALKGSKVLGFSMQIRDGANLFDFGERYAITPKSFVLREKKTVGRVLAEEIVKYCERNKLGIRLPAVRTDSGGRAFNRIYWGRRRDKPKPVTRKASWRAKHPR